MLSTYSILSGIRIEKHHRNEERTVFEATFHVVCWGLRATCEIVPFCLNIVAILLMPIKHLFGPFNTLGLIVFAPDRGLPRCHRCGRRRTRHVAFYWFHVHVWYAAAGWAFRQENGIDEVHWHLPVWNLDAWKKVLLGK